jgi:hypothetical protein
MAKTTSGKEIELTVAGLQDELWRVLQQVRDKKIKPSEANSITMAVKEICNITRLELQYKAMTSPNMKLARGSVPLLERK